MGNCTSEQEEFDPQVAVASLTDRDATIRERLSAFQRLARFQQPLLFDDRRTYAVEADKYSFSGLYFLDPFGKKYPLKDEFKHLSTQAVQNACRKLAFEILYCLYKQCAQTHSHKLKYRAAMERYLKAKTTLVSRFSKTLTIPQQIDMILNSKALDEEDKVQTYKYVLCYTPDPPVEYFTNYAQLIDNTYMKCPSEIVILFEKLKILPPICAKQLALCYIQVGRAASAYFILEGLDYDVYQIAKYFPYHDLAVLHKQAKQCVVEYLKITNLIDGIVKYIAAYLGM